MLVREIIKILGSTGYGTISFALLVLSFTSILDGLRNLLTKHIHDQEQANVAQIPLLLRSMERWNLLIAGLATICSFYAILIVSPHSGLNFHIPLAIAVGLMVAQSPYCAKLMAEGHAGMIALLKSLYWLVIYLTIWISVSFHHSMKDIITVIAIITFVLTVAYRLAGYGKINPLGGGVPAGFRLFLSLIGKGLAFNALSSILAFTDRILLMRLSTPQVFGSYAVLYDLGSKVAWFGTLAALSFFPTWSRLHSEGRSHIFVRHFWKTLGWTVFLMGGGFLVCVSLTPRILAVWLPHVILHNREYFVFKLIVGAAALQGVGTVVGYALLACRDMRSVLHVYALAVIITLAISPWMIYRWGLLGAAETYLLSRVADLLMLWVLYKKHLRPQNSTGIPETSLS